MKGPRYSEDDYYGLIADAMNGDSYDDPPMNFVAGPDEWKVVKAALARWIAAQEADVVQGADQLAVEQMAEPDA